MPIVLQKAFTDGPTEWELEQTTFGGGNLSTQEYWQYFGIVYCEYIVAVFRGAVLRILPVLPSISGFGTAGTACTRDPVQLILPILAVLGP